MKPQASSALTCVLTATGHERLIERRTVNDLTGLVLDVLIAVAIGTMSLAARGANIPNLMNLTVLAFGWSVVGMLWLGPRIQPENWFDHSIADTASRRATTRPASCSLTWSIPLVRPTRPAPTATSS